MDFVSSISQTTFAEFLIILTLFAIILIMIFDIIIPALRKSKRKIFKVQEVK